MVSPEEGGAVTAKIIDLGLAKALNEPLSEAGISMPGVFAGTPEFASPEQFGGMGIDIRSDLIDFSSWFGEIDQIRDSIASNLYFVRGGS
jgi:serine/threonine protein kinase